MTIDASRRSVVARLIRGAMVGASCGAAFGVLEGIWLVVDGEAAARAPLMFWAGLSEALVFAVVGALFETATGSFTARARPDPAASTAPSDAAAAPSAGALSAGARAAFGCCVVGALTLGRWRYYLDESLSMGEQPASKLLVVVALLALGALLGAILFRLVSRWGPARFAFASLSATIAIAAAFLVGWRADGVARPVAPTAGASSPEDRPGRAASTRPHVFLIVADSLRADVLSVSRPPSGRAAGGRERTADAPGATAARREVARTPELDRLARESVVFDSLCAQSSWTKPGFASILTGLPPQVHRAVRRTARLPRSVTTLAELFQASGYFTVGHSNANPNNSTAARFDQGFAEYADLEPPHRRLLAPPGATRLALYRQIVEPTAARLVGHEAGQFYVPADAYTDRVLARLRALPKAPARPIFAVLHYMDPHYPYFAGAKRGRPVLLGSEDHHAGGAALARSLREAYLGDVELLDRHLGRLFEGLRAQGLYDDAIIVFTSDHGEELFEHADWGHGRSLYREVIHVPLLVRLPQARGAGTRIAAQARQTDLAPTLLALAGLEIPEEMNGHPLVALDGRPGRASDDACHSSLDTLSNQIESLRTSDSTLIRTLRSKQRRLAPVELYDPLADPAEQTNLAERNAARVAELEAQLDAARALELEDADPDEEMPVARDVEAQLRALGYVDDD